MFAAGMMRGGGDLSFEEMKTQQLKEELAAHGSSRSGLKAALQRRVHGLLVQAAIAARAIAARAAEAEENGERMDDDDDATDDDGDDASFWMKAEAAAAAAAATRLATRSALMYELFGSDSDEA